MFAPTFEIQKWCASGKSSVVIKARDLPHTIVDVRNKRENGEHT